jgi:hypothetical protein
VLHINVLLSAKCFHFLFPSISPLNTIFRSLIILPLLHHFFISIFSHPLAPFVPSPSFRLLLLPFLHISFFSFFTCSLDSLSFLSAVSLSWPLLSSNYFFFFIFSLPPLSLSLSLSLPFFLSHRSCYTFSAIYKLRWRIPHFQYSLIKSTHDAGKKKSIRIWAILSFLDFYPPNWQSLFPLSPVNHLDQSKSNHLPILLCTKGESERSSRRRPTFRFEEFWTHHEECMAERSVRL